MPRASQEGPRPGLSLLEYGELVDLDRAKKYSLSPILNPREIPVHPRVFESPQVYTQEFADHVWASVPDSIRADISVIQDKIRNALPVYVTDDGVMSRRGPHLDMPEIFNAFSVQANPKQRSVWVEPLMSAEAINLGLGPEHHYRSDPRSPRVRSLFLAWKLKAYTAPETDDAEEGLINWHSHNVGMASLPLLLILRNFAIKFNNLGLQRVGAV